MIYAVTTRNNLDSLRLRLLYFL